MDASAVKAGMWQDITAEFKSSVSQLNLGELLKSDHFTLLEAMSAIELMDPKMDSGMILKKCNRKILNFDQSVKSGLIKINNLEISELLGIIDDTYSCLVTWLEGHLLSLTVMTNLYLHQPEKIEDRCLRIFSLSALKLTKFIDKMVSVIFCIEEEDFMLNMGKFNLDSQINDSKVLCSLEDLCQYYERLIEHDSIRTHNNSHGTKTNNTKTTNTNNKQADKHQSNSSSDMSPSKVNLELDKCQIAALVTRLRFTYNFFACFLHIHRHILKDAVAGMEFDNQTDAGISRAVKLFQNDVLLCDQHLEKCLEHLDHWSETIDMGIKPNPNQTDSTSEGIYPTIMGFEPHVNHKLLPATYPRCSSIKSRPSTIDYLRDLIIRMRHCTSISVSFYQKSLIKSVDLFENFSKYFRPSSCVISRSFLQTLYLPGVSIKLLRDEVVQSMTEFCEPLGQMMRKDEGGGGGGEEESQGADRFMFLTHSQKAFSQVVSIYGHNPSRQHERFSELITTFKNLQYESAFINSVAYSWTTYHLARLCIKYILSGLELELFSVHEYPYVFWYLYEILYKNEREQLDLARQFIEGQLLAEDAQKKAKGKKNRRKQSSTSFHDSNLLRNGAYRYLTGGTFLLTYGLKLQGKIRTPSMDFTSEEICFDHRFGALTGTSVYQSYQKTLKRLEKLEHIYREALDCFSEAKEIFTVLVQHEDCVKVCKANMVVTRILSSNLEAFKDREVQFNFDTHPSFPTVKF
ncbi:uncharacterized protein LOC126804753 [Argentina anserina]|uniref:uncharacterized protein LOC126804753 n=1 Tax=Argentina anserina TaxID=57926 RepID=UPI0021769297|nr:uncharacterized protein LOC126804753 [Potentilla anserina]